MPLAPTATSPAPPVVVDMTALDTAHRTRGIGRYAQGLMDGFCALNDPNLPLQWLRAPREGSPPLTHGAPYTSRTYGRRVYNGALSMTLENLLRLDGALQGAGLYHGLGMEAMAWRTPSVLTCHDLIPLLLPELYLRDLNQKLFWHAYPLWLKTQPRRIIAISHHVKSTLVHRGLDPGKIDVVYHGISPSWHPVSQEDALHLKLGLTQEPFFLFVGGFDPRKNFELVLKALAQIPASRRPRLLVAGYRHPKILAEHAAILPRYALGDAVRFLDYIDDADLRYLYTHARALLFPSLEEGWGFPIVEAMACGTPVLCANFGSMAESSGGAGLDVDLGDLLAVTAAMERLWEDDALCAALTQKGLARVEPLNWKACARATLEVYSKASAQGPF